MNRRKTCLHLLEEDAVFGADGEVLLASDASRDLTHRNEAGRPYVYSELAQFVFRTANCG